MEEGMNDSYFDVQTKIGLSKHLYGLTGTKELCDLCKVDSTKTVLVIGSGNGASACKIAQIYGSKVFGVDIRPDMVKFAEEYCGKNNVNVEFKVGDALNLPFERNTFDAVISESVTVFFSDKKRGIEEFKRVTKPGGYIGLGELTWLKEPSKKCLIMHMMLWGGVDRN